jgi:hypothetical protein
MGKILEGQKMAKKELIKNYSESAIVREFYSLNNQFLSNLIKINNLLDKNKVSEALDMFDTIKIFGETLEVLKKNLPSKEFMEKEKFLEKLRDQQMKIEEESKKTDLMLKVHLEIAKNVADFVKQQLVAEKMADTGYNSAGTISGKDETLRPVAYLSEV